MTTHAERYAESLMNAFGPPKLTLARGEGAHLWDDDGKHYVDFLGGIAVELRKGLPVGNWTEAIEDGPAFLRSVSARKVQDIALLRRVLAGHRHGRPWLLPR